MSGPKKEEQTVINSKNPIKSIQISPMRRPRISDITIDMTGWGNGVHGDEHAQDPSIHPYTVGFWDAAGVRQEFTSDNMNSSAFRDIMVSLRSSFGAYPDIETEVEIITPRDCLGNHNKPGALPYGCTVRTDVLALNDTAMGVMDYGVTYQGVAGSRLESCLDEICHQYSVACRAEKHEAIHRGKKFPNSVYPYYEIDERNADNFQRYLNTLSRDSMGRLMTGVPYGVDPKASELET